MGSYKILINTVQKRGWIINKKCPKSSNNGYVDVLKHCFNCTDYKGVLFGTCLRLICANGETITKVGVKVRSFDQLLALRGGYNRPTVKCVRCKNLKYVRKEVREDGAAWKCKIFNVSLERLLENGKYSNCIYFVKGR